MTARTRRGPGRPVGGRQPIDRDRILDAAERVIARDGAGASLESIAEEAGVTKPTVYARVGGRTELANALSERLADRLVGATSAAIGDRRYSRAMFATLIQTNLEVVADHRDLFLYVTGGTADTTAQHTLFLAERSAAPMTQMLSAWRTKHGLDPAVAAPWAYAVIGMLHLVSLWWITESDRPATELAAQLADLLWSGLSQP